MFKKSFFLSLAAALLLMFAFRTLVCTAYTIPGKALEPTLRQGDRILVNRWSYGLRTGSSNGLFPYGRLCHQQVGHGELVAFEDSLARVFIGRCKAVPGDTIKTAKGVTVVPGLLNCAKCDYYLMESVDSTASRQCLVTEEQIIGRVCMILFNHAPAAPVWEGYTADRLLLPL